MHTQDFPPSKSNLVTGVEEMQAAPDDFGGRRRRRILQRRDVAWTSGLFPLLLAALRPQPALGPPVVTVIGSNQYVGPALGPLGESPYRGRDHVFHLGMSNLAGAHAAVLASCTRRCGADAFASLLAVVAVQGCTQEELTECTACRAVCYHLGTPGTTGGEIGPWDLDHLIHSSDHTNSHIFVLFYIPRNRNCKRFLPVWDELNRRFASIHTVDVLKLDCSGTNAHACADHNVQRFPTMQVFRPGVPHGDVFEPSLQADLYMLEQWIHTGIDDPALRDPRDLSHHEPVPNCVAFRRTRGCDPYGDREHHKDRGCDDRIDNGVEGYCECSADDRRGHVECNHSAFTCRDVCHVVPGCKGWRMTSGCSPLGPPEPTLDLHCQKQVPPGVSGYCECSDGRIVHESTCARTVSFTCEKECQSGPPETKALAAAIRKINAAAARQRYDSEKRKKEEAASAIIAAAEAAKIRQQEAEEYAKAAEIRKKEVEAAARAEAERKQKEEDARQAAEAEAARVAAEAEEARQAEADRAEEHRRYVCLIALVAFHTILA